jgi:hypothetical protein
MIDTLPELMEYLDMRGGKYGIDALDLFNSIPESAREPELAYEFMQMKDISHIQPLSQGGDPAGDNWVLEDSSVNRSRGAEPMTATEQATAQADAHSDADQLKRAAKLGAALALGGAVVEPIATFSLAGLGALIEATVVVPVLLTGAAVAGTAVAGVAIHKKAQKEGWYSRIQSMVN